MWRLLALLGLSTALIAAGIIVSLRIGQQETVPFSVLFTRPDGSACDKPCLFGIQPGKTRSAEAIAMLRAHPLTQQFTQTGSAPFRMEGYADRIQIVSFHAKDSGVVDEITLATYRLYTLPVTTNAIALPNSGSLGDIVSAFGAPDFIQITMGSDPVVGFKQAGVLAALSSGQIDERLREGVPISRLTLFDYGVCPANSFVYVFPRWLGMADFRRYITGDTVLATLKHMNSAGANFAPCKPEKPTP
jgi:hypothetical protein